MRVTTVRAFKAIALVLATAAIVITLPSSAKVDVSRLEPETRQWIESLAAKGGPPVYTLTPTQARQMLDEVQSGNVAKMPADIEDRSIPGGPTGTIDIRILRPAGNKDVLPAVMYFHGGGWILGDKNTHDRLMRELTNSVRAAIVFVNYTPSPEAKYPTAIEQDYAAAKWVADNAKTLNLDATRLALAGDSVGGNMVAEVALRAKERGGPKVAYQVLLYPVTDANFTNASYKEFADGPWLTKPAMAWYWDNYLPDKSKRLQPAVSPLHASIEQLRDLPPALVITDENDVLRDEGEAFAHKLADAGVRVTMTRELGTCHDFAMLNPLSQTPATRAAIQQTSDMLRRELHPEERAPAPAMMQAPSAAPH